MQPLQEGSDGQHTMNVVFRPHINFLACPVWVGLLLTVFLPAVASAVQPQPPLELSIMATEGADHQRQLTLRVVSRIDADEVLLTLNLPQTVKKIEGIDHWIGKLSKGERREITLRIHAATEVLGDIIGQAIWHSSQWGTITQQVALVRDPVVPVEPLSRLTDGEGDVLLEYEAE